MAETIRVADLIARLLVQSGVSDCFMLTGGGAMHLNDALGAKRGCARFSTTTSRPAPLRRKAMRACVVNRLVNVTTGPGA
jgi:acetolactate synthase-1/2/3 large subunit